MKLWKVVLSVLFIALLLPMYTALAADVANPVQLTLDGKKLEPRVPARIVDNYTLVPIRVITEQFGAQIEWDGDKQKVTIRNGKLEIQLFVNRKDTYVNGVQTTFSVAPINENDTVLVPLRFVLERFDVTFKYDEKTKTVHMTQTKPAAPPESNEGNGGSASVPDSNKPCETNVTINSGAVNGTVQGTTGASGAAAVTNAVSGGCDNGSQQAAARITGINMAPTGLFVSSDAKELKATVTRLSNPERIAFDFADATLDPVFAELAKTGVGQLPSGHPLVSQVRFSQYSQKPATVRVTLDLKEKAFYYPILNSPVGQFAAEISKSFIPASKAVEVNGVKKYTVVLDAGHGGGDSGALAEDLNRQEKEFNLAMVKKVGAILEKEQNLIVLYTRKDDTFVELDDRAKFANDANAALFLSIHANSYLKSSQGVETYYWREDSVDLANLIHDYVLDAGGLKDRGVRQNNFRVVVKTTMPAVLLEAGFLSNKEEATLLYNEAYQNKLAAGIAEAIKTYVGK